jgi:acyl-CoA synthetase (AMP-forming)/AMP-acid ligase II
LPGLEVKLGKDGRIAVKSDARATGSDLPASDHEFENDFYLTLDQGRIEGAKVIVTRCIGKAINVAGRKVSPGRLRRILEGMPGVRFASVECGKSRDFERYEEIRVSLRVDQSFDKKAAREQLRNQVQSWEMPRQWELDAE